MTTRARAVHCWFTVIYAVFTATGKARPDDVVQLVREFGDVHTLAPVFVAQLSLDILHLLLAEVRLRAILPQANSEFKIWPKSRKIVD